MAIKFFLNVTLNSTFNCPKKTLVLLASNALSKAKTIQIYGDKFLFQNIHFADSIGFWGAFKFLNSQKILASEISQSK